MNLPIKDLLGRLKSSFCKPSLSITTFLLSMLFLSSSHIKADQLVTSASDNPNDTALTLRAAIAAAGPNESITFIPAINGRTITLNSQLLIDKNLTDRADIGSTEFTGLAESRELLALNWNTDADGDGAPYGLEVALGKNPLVANQASAIEPFIGFRGSGATLIRVSFSRDAVGLVEWFFERSTDLTASSWDTIYSSTDPDNDQFLGPKTTSISNGVHIVVTDTNFSDRAFYRFRAELIEG